MKNLITAIASLVLIMTMLMQMTLNERNYTRMIAIDQLVNNFKEVAREEGLVSSANKSNLISEISGATGIGEKDITVSGTSSRVNRGGKISYKVSVKMDKIYTAPAFFGISKEKNEGRYVVENSTTSEYI
ncbi:MAG: hypothetical protein MJ146_03260 [Clostridia bacterium]|nr:hypothetical protein [Clostridia bacterium]